MELTEVDKKFVLQILKWLNDGREWKIAGGATGKNLGERLIEIEKIFDDSKIIKITRGEKLLGFMRLIDSGGCRLVFHAYISREYRNKGYGYFAIKKLIEEKFQEGYQEIATCASGMAKEYLKRWPIWEDQHKKIGKYNIFRVTKDKYYANNTPSSSNSHSRRSSSLSNPAEKSCQESRPTSRRRSKTAGTNSASSRDKTKYTKYHI